mmetsp:Transcript_5122/g.14304  ORF Transcript_5122/g.14304 Transcript_5122/m.14304 type:complete len:191 (-) Transcript_5122:404-976(-)
MRWDLSERTWLWPHPPSGTVGCMDPWRDSFFLPRAFDRLEIWVDTQVMTTDAAEPCTDLHPAAGRAAIPADSPELPVAGMDRLSMSQSAATVPQPSKAAVAQQPRGSEESIWEVVCARGPVASLPDEHSSRRERFQELDDLQPGWTVELRARAGASTVDACFFDAEGKFYKSYAAARRAALQHKKQSGGH